MSNKLSDNKHLILMGFKHVGKSIIGHQLAEKMGKPFIDLDHQIEDLFNQECKKKLSPRSIMQTHGETFFRRLETKALHKTLQLKSSIIALGGGTPLCKENQRLLKPHLLIYIKAPLKVVFKRIMASGQPAFFSARQDPYVSFIQLWETREKVYEALANFSVDNDNTIEQAVLKIMEKLEI